MADEKKDEAQKYERYEDDPKNVNILPEDFKPAKLSSKEVPLEESRKDHTTLLATDRVSIGPDGEFVIEKQ